MNGHQTHPYEIIDIAQKYDRILKTITEANGIDEVAARETAADLAFDNIVFQPGVECSLIVRAGVLRSHLQTPTARCGERPIWGRRVPIAGSTSPRPSMARPYASRRLPNGRSNRRAWRWMMGTTHR
jgi:hypothetical protein